MTVLSNISQSAEFHPNLFMLSTPYFSYSRWSANPFFTAIAGPNIGRRRTHNDSCYYYDDQVHCVNKAELHYAVSLFFRHCRPRSSFPTVSISHATNERKAPLSTPPPLRRCHTVDHRIPLSAHVCLAVGKWSTVRMAYVWSVRKITLFCVA